MPQEASVRALHMCSRGTHLPGALAHRSNQEVLREAGLHVAPPSTWAGIPGQKIQGNVNFHSRVLLITPMPLGPQPSDTETRPELCCNVFIMCQKKLHHSLLHTSVGDCSLACIYYNEVETSHTDSQIPGFGVAIRVLE